MSDLISRADAIEAVCGKCSEVTRAECAEYGYYCCDRRELEVLPSAEAPKPTGELISRADAIEAIFKVGHEHVEEKVIPLGAITDYSDAIKALPSAEAVQGWIPCSEKLPDVDVEVLTTTDWSEVRIAWLIKGGAWETEDYIFDSDEIIAWMPLPKPYKGGEDE